MTATARPNAPLITGADPFSAVWPQVFSDVVRLLRRRGVDLHAAEDAAQEAGARAFDLNVPFDDAADLRRWVLTAAKRIAIDDARKVARIDRDAEVDSRSRCDVHAEAEGRLRLAAVRDAVPRLTPVERAAIFADQPATATRKEAVRLAVRRHRARTHLLQLIEGVAAILLVAWRRASRPAAVAVAGAPIVLVVLLSGPHARQDAPVTPPAMAEQALAGRATTGATPGVAGEAPATSPEPVSALERPRAGPGAAGPASGRVEAPPFQAEIVHPGADGPTRVSGGAREPGRAVFCYENPAFGVQPVCVGEQPVEWPLGG